jgi:hypothetical protein
LQRLCHRRELSDGGFVPLFDEWQEVFEDLHQFDQVLEPAVQVATVQVPLGLRSVVIFLGRSKVGRPCLDRFSTGRTSRRPRSSVIRAVTCHTSFSAR